MQVPRLSATFVYRSPLQPAPIACIGLNHMAKLNFTARVEAGSYIIKTTSITIA